MHTATRPYKSGTPRGDAFDRGIAFAEQKLKSNPAPAAYFELQKAYDYFNAELFGGQLPAVMLAQHRHPRSYGYWGNDRWSAGGQKKAGELGMNPEYLKSRPLAETLATLVHEQCHVWQTYFGDAPRSSYHNREWADKMEDVGLMPSTTGAPGGKRTGPSVTHYIIDGGKFQAACRRLIGNGFALTWGAVKEPKGGIGGSEGEEGGEAKPKASKSGKRIKYVCLDCEAAAWGKDGLNLMCGECEERMEAA